MNNIDLKSFSFTPRPILAAGKRGGFFMPRTARIIPEEGFLHVMCRGNNRRKIFRTNSSKTEYRSLLKEFRQEDQIKIHHYCILDNHAHLLVWLEQQSNLARFMKRVNLTYFHYYRKRFTYLGYLWQGRYKSKLILEYKYLMQCGKYIELNAVRAGMAGDPKEYEFSSFNYYAFGKADDLIDENPYYLELGRAQEERQACYRSLFIEDQSKDLL